MRRGSFTERLFADWNTKGTTTRIAAWAADKRTTVPLIGRALDDVRATEPKAEWDTFSLKLDYLEMMSEFDEKWGIVQQGDSDDQHIKVSGEELPPSIVGSIYAARRYVLNEPERSRRVIRLVFANWLAHVEEQDASHRKPAVRAMFARQSEFNAAILSPGSDAPAAARALIPEDPGAGSSARGMRGCCFTNSRGHRFASRNEGNTTHSSACSPGNFISATEERPRLPTKLSSGLISIICLTTDRMRSTTASRLRCGIDEEPRGREGRLNGSIGVVTDRSPRGTAPPCVGPI